MSRGGDLLQDALLNPRAGECESVGRPLASQPTVLPNNLQPGHRPTAMVQSQLAINAVQKAGYMLGFCVAAARRHARRECHTRSHSGL